MTIGVDDASIAAQQTTSSGAVAALRRSLISRHQAGSGLNRIPADGAHALHRLKPATGWSKIPFFGPEHGIEGAIPGKWSMRDQFVPDCRHELEKGCDTRHDRAALIGVKDDQRSYRRKADSNASAKRLCARSNRIHRFAFAFRDRPAIARIHISTRGEPT
jgi:hypothetical protein